MSELQNFPIYNSEEQVNIKINGTNQSLIFINQGDIKVLTDSFEEPTFAIIQLLSSQTFIENYTNQDIILSYNNEKIHPIN
jgi:hypothetical protein